MIKNRVIASAISATAVIAVVATGSSQLAHAAVGSVTPQYGVTGHFNTQMCGSNSYERVQTKVTEFAVIDSSGTCVNSTKYITRFSVAKIITDIGWQYPAIISGYVPEGEATCADPQKDTCFTFPVEESADGHPVASFGSWLAPGMYNESFDMWFSPVRSHHSVKTRTGDTEIMVWTAHPGINESGHYVAYATIEGKRYGIMSWNAGHSGTTWKYVAYVWLNAPAHVGKGRALTIRNLYLNPFFQDSIKRGWLSSHEYLWSIALGFELCSGGLNDIHDYSLTGLPATRSS
jgi:hypothetical protein